MKIKDLNLPPNTVVDICPKCGGLLQIKEGMYVLRHIIPMNTVCFQMN